MLEDDYLATGEELPINTPQLTKRTSECQSRIDISTQRSAATTLSSAHLPAYLPAAPNLGLHPVGTERSI